MGRYDPVPEDRFTFGLWTVNNPGADPFGSAVRERMSVRHIVEKLAELGAYGVNFHDNDLVPFGSSATERDRIVADFKQALADTGMVVPMATTNLFAHPVFKDGAFTANDPQVRAYALQKTMDAIDLGVECGASTYVCWGGREGTDSDACRDPKVAIQRMRDAFNYLCEYVLSRDYELRFALEPKPNEPRCNIYLPTVGHMMAFIDTLDHPQMLGVNPEVAHETMSGLSFHQGVAQALEAGKLYHIDLNGQKIGRYDQDLRFGSEDIKGALNLVRVLEGTMGGTKYEGPLHFDAHAYRTEDEQGVWDFALGCMRTYNILKEKAHAFDNDPEVQEIIATPVDGTLDPLLEGFTLEGAGTIRATTFDVDALGGKGLRYERLDQLMMEHLMGVRG
ncbi:MAG: xylose isomerase [Actinobacteria bacterium]|nr:xylose isomerase [Actinomycetota bacterium]